MPAGNANSNFGSVTKTLHWLTALLIISAFPLGIIANDAPFSNGQEIAQKAWLFSMHKTIGVTAFFTALARILWAISQPKPAPLNTAKPFEVFLADFIHWLLYFSMLMVPLSGWLNHAASNLAAPIWLPFGASLPFIPKSEYLSAIFSGGHFVFTKLLFIAVALHVAGALKHAFFDRDATLTRMLPGKTDVGELPARPVHRAPLLAALMLYSVAMFVGVTIGMSTDVGKPVVQLAPVASGWIVETGSIDVRFTQFGSDVTGSILDWTASIEFDPDSQGGTLGHVDVTMNMASFDFGTLSGQAMGPDFFDTEIFATASFQADITAEDENYLATGELRIKDITLPVVLPFALTLDGEHAAMSGRLTLNRLDFGLGKSLPDESSLKFLVDVTVKLLARRG